MRSAGCWPIWIIAVVIPALNRGHFSKIPYDFCLAGLIFSLPLITIGAANAFGWMLAYLDRRGGDPRAQPRAFQQDSLRLLPRRADLLAAADHDRCCQCVRLDAGLSGSSRW